MIKPCYVDRAVAAVADEMPESLPDDLVDLYVLLAWAKGAGTTLEDVHEAWALWRRRTRPDHPSLVPFDRLTLEVQELDRPYMEAIHRAAKALKRRHES